MKHIARHFLNQLTEEQFKEVEKQHAFEQYSRGEDGAKLNKRKITKQSVAFLKTVNDFYVKGFPHKVNGQTFTFPEPDPTLIYFSNAQRFRREIDMFKTTLLPKLNMSNTNVEDFTHDYYNYFGAVCGTIIFLFTSLESFMNSLLEVNDKYVRQLSNKTEIFNYEQIQEGINFGEKIKVVIPQLKGKDYFKSHPLKAKSIEGLKEFRNCIIHTKTKDDIIQHDFVIKRSFTFQYDDVINTVAEYMNFYKPDYVTECGCSSDF